MATRRMRIKATINVPRGGTKIEPQENPTPTPVPPASSLVEPSVPSSPAPTVSSSRPLSSPVPCSNQEPPVDVPVFKEGGGGGGPVANPPPSPVVAPTPNRIPSSPSPTKSISPAPWQSHQHQQRPSPSKSPALPPSGTILRRSPSPALSRLTNSPGPPLIHGGPASPIPSYSSPQSPVKFFSRTPVVILPTTNVQRTIFPGDPPSYPFSPSSVMSGSADLSLKSQVPINIFRPPPSPSPSSHHDFHSVKSPPTPSISSSGGAITISRPSPAQSPVYGGISRPPSNSSANFLFHHLNSNSNSADSHEVAALMGGNSANLLSPSTTSSSGPTLHPPSTERRPHSSSSNRGSENLYPGGGGGQGAFSAVSSNVNPSPTFAKTMFENPENLKKRSNELRKKESAMPNPTKFAAARKEFFDKLQNGQTPERSKLTMLHYTFYNPPNPSGSTKLTLAKRKSRSRASSICSDASSIAKIEPDTRIEDTKANSAPSSIAGSRRTTASSVASGGSCAASDAGQSDAGSVASNASSGGSMPGPRVKVGPDGQLILDEKSLVVETSESQRARQQIEDMEVVSGAEYAVGSSGFYRYKKNYRRGQDWTERETIRFYRALNQCGTDFSMMLALFPHRTRAELKSKFKREDRRNPDMVSKALASCIFDPDEGISSDEELSEINGTGTEKDRLLNEEKEAEEVICSSEDGVSKKKKVKTEGGKKKEIQFSTVQIQEFKAFSASTKGAGTGKGKKWNTPVEGLKKGEKIGEHPMGIITIPKIKEEDITPPALGVAKPKKKYGRKPKAQKSEDSGVCAGAATITAGPVPGTVSIIIASGAISTPPPATTISEVKKEKTDNPPAKVAVPGSGEKKSNDSGAETGSKRRNRLPKKKPNLKIGLKGGKEGVEEKEGGNSSQSNKKANAVCEDLFRFDESDPLGLKVVPEALPVAQETDLEGNEEGSEGLVIVDLDELKSVQREAQEMDTTPVPSSSTKIKAPPKKRKNAKEHVTPPVISRVVVDPYGKTVMTGASTSAGGGSSTTVASDKGVGGGGPSTSTGQSSSQPASKKVKVLPYRVPGPGGAPPSTSRASLADELEIEIELSTPSNES